MSETDAPPLTITDRLRMIEPGGSEFFENAPIRSVSTLTSKVKKVTHGIYIVRAREGGVKVWRIAEERRKRRPF